MCNVLSGIWSRSKEGRKTKRKKLVELVMVSTESQSLVTNRNLVSSLD